MKWQVGLTTVPSRRSDLLPRTLASLKAAGFPSPRLFVDGCNDGPGWEREFGLGVTTRFPKLNVYGNWVLGLAELLVREPHADRYAMFQDDLVTCRGLREYLEGCEMPARGYLNLYTYAKNAAAIPAGHQGWHPAAERGKGALGLVFTREAVLALLTHQDAAAHIVERPLHPTRGWRAVDGGVVDALRKAGWREFVHAPSLLQHVGQLSAMDKRRSSTGRGEGHPTYDWGDRGSSPTFPGEDFDATSLLTPPTGQAASPTPGTPTLPAEHWRGEVAAIEAAVKGDEERMQRAETHNEWERCRKAISDYGRRLTEARRRLVEAGG